MKRVSSHCSIPLLETIVVSCVPFHLRLLVMTFKYEILISCFLGTTMIPPPPFSLSSPKGVWILCSRATSTSC